MITRRIRRPEIATSSEHAIIGIDPSLTGTGIALMVGGKLIDHQGWTEVKKLQKADSEHLNWWKIPTNSDKELARELKETWKQYRIHAIADWVARLIEMWALVVQGAPVVAIEGYAYSKRSTGLSDIHEMCGVIKTALWQAGIPFRIYDPGTIKLAWTGDGHATKEDMIRAASNLHGVDLSPCGSAGENLADAILIASLLSEEMAVRDGDVALKDLRPALRRVFLRTTAAAPVALVSRPFTHCSNALGHPPVMSSKE